MNRVALLGVFVAGLLLASAVQQVRYLKLEAEHADALLAEAAKMAEVQSKLQKVANETETKYLDAKTKLDAEAKRNRDLLVSYRRVRDTAAATAATPDPAGAPQETPRTTISESDAEFLVEYARLADEAAIYANACYDWVESTVAARSNTSPSFSK